MIVPQYWAESRIRVRKKKRQVTIRRWGWSDVDLASAQALADERAREALEQVLAGTKLRRAEPKRAYNGVEGVPIREEIVSRSGETVVTRNAYGALCLNTPNVMFVDIDLVAGPPAAMTLTAIALCLLLGLGVWWKGQPNGLFGLILPILATGFGIWLARMFSRVIDGLTGGPPGKAIARINRFSENHPDWSMRLYRTPAGFRVLVTHRTFSTDDPEVDECFKALAADKMYARMCRNQKCFRARISPKPWRVGIARHLRPGVWPISPERLEERERWVEAYDQACEGRASCAYVMTVGSGVSVPETTAVQRQHDDLCKADGGLPLA